MNSDEFSLLPLNPADDVCEILRIHYQNYLSDAFYSSALESRQTEEDFINDRIESIINQHSKPGALGAKLVLEKHPERMVGYIVFQAPEKDLRTPEQRDADLREQIAKRSDGQKKKDQVYRLKTEERNLNEKYLGKEYEGRWWTLDVLIVDEKYQKRGLGSRLVKWGLEKVQESIGQWNSSLDGADSGKEKIEGVYLVASPAGARTYEKAGFSKVGEKKLDFEGKGEGEYAHAWFVKRFE